MMRKKVFICGTSTYYCDFLPLGVEDEINKYIKKKCIFFVGDAPGIDTVVQRYLASKKYKRVEIFVTRYDVRMNADSDKKLGWKIHNCDSLFLTPYHSREWYAIKDKVMCEKADIGIAVIRNGYGSKATKANILRLINNVTPVKIFTIYDDSPYKVYQMYEDAFIDTLVNELSGCDD